MLRPLLRLSLCGAILLAVMSAAVAQDKDKDPEDYRRFFKKPETALEFWNALRFELDVGRPDLAGRLLRGLIEKKPTGADLLAIIDKDGLFAILKLRNIRDWFPDKKDKKLQDQALKDVEELISRATAAQKKRLGDPARIRNLIAQLKATPEERAHALRELYKAGSAAVPVLVDSLIKATDPGDRLSILRALERMGPSSTAPLIAALDCDDAATKVDILEILRKRHGRDASRIVPFLWYYTAAKDESPAVRKKATQVLEQLLDVEPGRLTSAKVALTREAERYYNHQVTFGDPKQVTVWRWDGKQVVQGWPGAPTVSASQAEEYYGLRFARRALNLDPAYRPAQVVMLSLAIDKAMERGGLAAPLSRTAPAVAELLARAQPELVIEVLDRALKEKRTGVVLAAVQSLGARGEVRAKRPTGAGDPPLVRALYYPDPRVQLAAVQGLLRIPGAPAPRTSARIVEILARALTPLLAVNPGRKVLVAVADEDWRAQVSRAVTEAGDVPVPAGTGREVMRKLRAGGDIVAVLLDSTLPLPGLPHLLAQMRADVDVARIPVVLAAVPETPAARDVATRYQRARRRLDMLGADTSRYSTRMREISSNEEAALKKVEAGAYTLGERERAVQNVREKYALLREDVRREFPGSAELLKENPRLQAELSALAKRYDLESRVREDALARFTRRYANVRVVHPSLLTDARGLESTLRGDVRDAGVALPPAEQRQAAETAIRILASLAQGRPPGFDVKPATATILEALRVGRLSPEGQLAAIGAASRLPGTRTQSELAHVILDAARTLPVRTAAAEALAENIQRFSIQLREKQFAELRALARQDKLDAGLKERLDVLLGSLRPGDRTTGARLRGYKPRPAAVIPPPK
jgi:hypothetical protein